MPYNLYDVILFLECSRGSFAPKVIILDLWPLKFTKVKFSKLWESNQVFDLRRTNSNKRKHVSRFLILMSTTLFCDLKRLSKGQILKVVEGNRVFYILQRITCHPYHIMLIIFITWSKIITLSHPWLLKQSTSSNTAREPSSPPGLSFKKFSLQSLGLYVCFCFVFLCSMHHLHLFFEVCCKME